MSSYQYLTLVVISVFVWLMILDPNIIDYLFLLFKVIQVKIARLFWLVKYHPNNFITTFIRNREYHKIAKELEKEFEERS